MEHGLDINQNVKVRELINTNAKIFLFLFLEIRCPSLKVHPRVIQECLPQQMNTKFQFGTKCRAKCNETSYRLIGPRIRECLSMGRWTGYEQFCIGECITIDRKEQMYFLSSRY